MSSPLQKIGSDVAFHFKGRLAVVTGSTAGIGFAIAQQYVRSGANVIVNGRDQKTVDVVVTKLGKEATDAKQTVKGVAADVSTAAGCEALLAAAASIGPIDFLVNNTSIFSAKPFENVTDEEWMNYWNVNVMSCVRLCRPVLPDMIKRNAHGRIIIISSECGLRPIPAMVPYSLTKASQISLARGLAELTHGTTVTVNSLLPGPTSTEGVDAYLKGRLPLENADRAKRSLPPLSLEEFAAGYCKATEPTSIIERFIKPEEVALATLYLCTVGAGPVNGTSQRVEGGVIRHI